MPGTVLGTVARVAKKTDTVSAFTEFTVWWRRLNQQMSFFLYSPSCLIHSRCSGNVCWLVGSELANSLTVSLSFPLLYVCVAGSLVGPLPTTCQEVLVLTVLDLISGVIN